MSVRFSHFTERLFQVIKECDLISLLRSNIVTATELTHVKGINKYILFRPHISVEYNNISWCSEEDTSRIH